MYANLAKQYTYGITQGRKGNLSIENVTFKSN
jgi:hypothetical protein